MWHPTRWSRRKLLGTGLAAAGLAATGIYINSRYTRAMAEVRDNISAAGSTLVETRFGTLEYADAGSGPVIMVVHGSGGGFDQGLLFGAEFADAGYRIIAPSRFGYLRSDYPEDASPENQADALVDLLDVLQIEKVAIAGLSAGALTVLAFAIRHPERCAALLPIVPAAYVPDSARTDPWSPMQERIVTSALRSDFLFWAILNLAPDIITRNLLATDPALLTTPAAQARAEAFRQSILPVSDRAQGLLNDMRRSANPPRMDYEAITVPTLAISAEDDIYGTANAARFIADHVPGARVHIFADGGHILIDREAEMAALVDSFLQEIGYRPAG